MTAIDFDLKGTNIYLIGMMGAGKSTVGQCLAQQLGYHFFDTDTLITQATGCSVTKLFEEAGEAGFRRLETQTLEQIAAHTRLVVATGGGIVIEKLNWSYLHHGLIVWLDASPQILWQRLKTDQSRPLLQAPNPQEILAQLLQQRQPLYAQADVHVTIEPEDTPEAVIQRLLTAIPRVLRSEQPQP